MQSLKKLVQMEKEKANQSAKPQTAKAAAEVAFKCRVAKSGVVPGPRAKSHTDYEIHLRRSSAINSLRTLRKYWHWLPAGVLKKAVKNIVSDEPKFENIDNKIAVCADAMPKAQKTDAAVQTESHRAVDVVDLTLDDGMHQYDSYDDDMVMPELPPMLSRYERAKLHGGA